MGSLQLLQYRVLTRPNWNYLQQQNKSVHNESPSQVPTEKTLGDTDLGRFLHHEIENLISYPMVCTPTHISNGS